MRIFRMVAWVTLTLASMASLAYADRDRGQASLVGLRGVKFLVKVNWGGPGARGLVHQQALELKVPIQLLHAEIPVLKDIEAASGDNAAVLALTADVTPASPARTGAEPGAYVVTFRLALSQYLWAVWGGRPQRPVWADTWTDGSVVTCSASRLKSGAIDAEAARLVLDFTNDWKAAHGNRALTASRAH